MQSDEYLATPAAARLVNLSESTLTKLRLTGGGPSYLKLGRRVVYSRRALDRWMLSHERVSTSDPGGLVRAA
jgi:hypothetical protein